MIRFFRPLTSMSLMLDHALFGSSAVGYHLTSLLLWVCLLATLHWTYRGLGLSGGLALAALAFFAVSSSAVLPVAWLANRNTLLEVVFTVGAVGVAGRACCAASVAGALLLAVLAALCKESGIVAFPLVAAGLLAARHAGRFRRPAWADVGMITALLLAVAHLAFLALAGYGTKSLFYASPWGDPVRFATQLGINASTGMLSLASPFPSDLVAIMPALVPGAVALSVVVVVPLAVWIWRAAADHPTRGLLGLWCVLSVLPQGAPPPSDRLWLGAAVGCSGLFALAAARALGPGQTRGSRRAGIALVASAGVASAFFVLVQELAIGQMSRDLRATILAADVGPTEVGRRDLFVLQADNALIPISMASTLAIEAGDENLRVWLMQTGRRALEWKRVDERTFELASRDHPFLTDMFEIVYLAEPVDPVVGATWDTELFTVTALEFDDEGGLLRFRWQFADDLDPVRSRFLVPRDGRLTAIEPPAVGETLTLESVVPQNPFTP